MFSYCICLLIKRFIESALLNLLSVIVPNVHVVYPHCPSILNKRKPNGNIGPKVHDVVQCDCEGDLAVLSLPIDVITSEHRRLLLKVYSYSRFHTWILRNISFVPLISIAYCYAFAIPVELCLYGGNRHAVLKTGCSICSLARKL